MKLNDKNGIDIGIGKKSIHPLVYETAIPLKEFFPEDVLHLNELMTLSIHVNALNRTAGNVETYGGGGITLRGGEMRGGMGGGDPSEGDMSGGGSPNRGSMFEKVSFKQKFKLVGN